MLFTLRVSDVLCTALVFPDVHLYIHIDGNIALLMPMMSRPVQIYPTLEMIHHVFHATCCDHACCGGGS